jgi:hypothetical protein
MPSDLGTPSEPAVGMTSPAKIDRLGRPEPAEREAERARFGLVHSEPPGAVLDGREAIRLLPIVVHIGHEMLAASS